MSQTNRKKIFLNQWKAYKEVIEEALSQALEGSSCCQEKVIEAMRYSLLGGGKRIRAILVLEFARMGGVSVQQGDAGSLRAGNDSRLFPDSRRPAIAGMMTPCVGASRPAIFSLARQSHFSPEMGC